MKYSDAYHNGSISSSGKPPAACPANSAITIVSTPEGPAPSVERLEKLEEPTSLAALRTAIEARLPRLDLPELIMEMHARTGFADLFTHASEGGARAEEIATSVCAVLRGAHSCAPWILLFQLAPAGPLNFRGKSTGMKTRMRSSRGTDSLES